jgi:mono/diheme cytochrome c family protein
MSADGAVLDIPRSYGESGASGRQGRVLIRARIMELQVSNVGNFSRHIAAWTLAAAALAVLPAITEPARAQNTSAPSHDASANTRAAAPRNTLAAQGQYVATEADCMSCHTAPGGQPYAGGYPLKSPLGTLYGPNITPDPDTGIGSWSKADFIKALRQGIGKDGSYLYPAMPYEDYTKMTDADMDALWAYMRSVRPVKNTPPKNTLPFPFNVRSGLALWQAVYFKPGPFVPDNGKPEQWNRGAYLVQVMGHCSQCHTPRNLAQALETKHNLAGAQIEGWYAPDISNDPGSQLNSWSVQQLAKFLKTGAQGNAKAVGPMQEAVHDSLRLLTDADISAIAVYLKDQPRTDPVTAAKPQWAGDRVVAGQTVYQNNCVSCHQSNGKGIAGSVPALAGDGAVTAKQPDNVIMALLEGFKPQGTWGAMGSFANTLSDDQIADVTNYVRTAWGNDASPNATPWAVGRSRSKANAPNNEAHALLCPSLATDVLQPALKASADSLSQAAGSSEKMSGLVRDYRAARPGAAPGEVVEALSTAYCRSLAQQSMSEASMSEKLSDFAQQAASAVSKRTAQPKT